MKKFLLSITTIVFAALVLAACTGTDVTTEAPTEVTTTEAGIEVLTPEWQSHTVKPQVLRKKMFYTTINGVTYNFNEEEFADEAQRNVYVSEMNAFLHCIAETFKTEVPEGVVVYVDGSLAPVTEGFNVCVNTEDIGTTHGLTQLFFTMTGENVDYGLAFGLTDYIATTLNMTMYEGTGDETTEFASFKITDKNAYLLDFTMPMFEAHFVDEDSVKIASRAALSFTKYLIEKKGVQEVWQQVFGADDEEEAKIAAEKNEWIQNLGGTIEYTPMARYFYYHSAELKDMEAYPYKFDGYRVIWNFKTKDVQAEGYPEFIEGFQQLNALMADDLDDAVEYFAKYANTDLVPPINVFTAFVEDGTQNENASAVYINAQQRIEVYNSWLMSQYSLLHEYCHYLTISCNRNEMSSVLYEGMAEAISSFYLENRMSREFYKMWLEGRLDAFAERNVYDAANDEWLLDNYSVYGGVVEYKNTNDGPYLCIIGVMMDQRPNSDVIKPSELTYDDACMFTAYLMETYGTDFVMTNCATFDDFLAAVGKDFRTLFTEYGNWLFKIAEERGII